MKDEEDRASVDSQDQAGGKCHHPGHFTHGIVNL